MEKVRSTLRVTRSSVHNKILKPATNGHAPFNHYYHNSIVLDDCCCYVCQVALCERARLSMCRLVVRLAVGIFVYFFLGVIR